jgi:hypothetical protein
MNWIKKPTPIFQKITGITSHLPTFDQPTSPSTTALLHQNGTSRQNGSAVAVRPQATAKEALKRFIILRFNYTPSEAIAEFFPLMGCRCYQVPEELPRLVAHLHGIETTSNSLLEFSADHAHLDESIRSFVRFRSQNLGYLEERWVGLNFLSNISPFLGSQINQIPKAWIN